MDKFKDRVVVITGAGSGIGRALARQFAERGAVLTLNDWNEPALEETWAELPAAARGVKAVYDVGDRAAVEAFAATVERELGRADIVINNAGLSVRPQPLASTSLEDFEETLRVNLYGVIYGSLAFLPLLRRQSGASLVNVSSVFGLCGFPGSGSYNVSKFAVRGFTETLRVEMGELLHVACVHPGGIATNIHRNVDIEDGPERERFLRTFEKQAITTAEAAAATIIRGIERRRARILIGKDARRIDRIARLLPATYERVLMRWFDARKFHGKAAPAK